MNLFSIPSTEKDAVEFLKTKEILSPGIFFKGNHKMKL